MMKRLMIHSAAVLLLLVSVNPAAASLVVFSADFSSGAPVEFSGWTATESVQGYTGIGTGSNTFANSFLRNATGRNFDAPASLRATILTLTGLPAHESIDLNFLLAIIDSWDGTTISNSPDYFNVRIDGNALFSETFANFGNRDPTYVPPSDVQLTPLSNLGFNTWQDSAYDMGLDPTFDAIPHTSSTLVIEWVASGSGYEGGSGESWAIDNVEVILNSTSSVVPEPSSFGLLCFGLAASCCGTFWRRHVRVAGITRIRTSAACRTRPTPC